MNTFYVGQKVVCVNDQSNAIGNVIPGAKFTPWEGFIKNGEVYTIRSVEFYEAKTHYVEGWVGIRLVGIDRGVPDTPFHSSRFRPLVDEPQWEATYKQWLKDIPEDLKEQENVKEFEEV